MDEFTKISSEFLGDSDKPIVLEVFVTDENESAAYNKIVSKNSKFDIEKVSKKTKNIIKNKIKKIINR